MFAWLRRHWLWLVPTGVVFAAVGLWLVFGYFAFHLYFVDDPIDEAMPVFDSQMAMMDDADDMAGDDMGDDGMSGADDMAGDDMTNSDMGNADVTDMDDADMGDDGAEPEPSTTTAPPEPVIATEAEGQFMDRSHPTAGTVMVLGDGTGQRFLRFDSDFKTDNGPDLDVYLSAAPPDASTGELDNDFINLGDLKGTSGSQNYEIPRDVDLSHYSTVAVWCVRFSVVFGTAELAAP